MGIIDGNKHIFFHLHEQKPKTQVWLVVNKSSHITLGQIKWYGAWRQYIFVPINNSIYNDGCLQVIIEFIGKLNKERMIKGEK